MNFSEFVMLLLPSLANFTYYKLFTLHFVPNLVDICDKKISALHEIQV